MRKRHRQIPTGLPELDQDENELFQRIDQERLERRHAWKRWLALIGIFAVSGALILAVHPFVGIGAFFLMLYLGKEFNPSRRTIALRIDEASHDQALQWTGPAECSFVG